MTFLLGNQHVLSTRDLDEARLRIGRELCPHRLDITGDSAEFHARLHTAPLGPLTLFGLRYGARVRIDHEHVDGTYILMLPCTGATEVTAGSEQMLASGKSAAMLCPDTRLTKVLRSGSSIQVVRFDGSMIETVAGQLLGRRPTKPVRFDLGLNLGTPRARGLLDLLDIIRRDLERNARIITHPLAAHYLRNLLVTELLLLAKHNLSESLHAHDAPVAAPRRIRAAADLIESHADEPLTVQEIAEAVGVGVRSLQSGFRAHLNTTPMGYLRQIRLKRAHEELASASPADNVTVTATAYRWGFLHLSRFAQVHEAAYGELPSATLKR